MTFCIICNKPIDEKYETCWNCLETRKRENSAHLVKFTCANCKQTMYSMLWPGRFCYNCYNHQQAKLNKRPILEIKNR